MKQANRNKTRVVEPTGGQTSTFDELPEGVWGLTFLSIGIFMFPFDLFAELRGGIPKEIRTDHNALLYNFYVSRIIPLRGRVPLKPVDLVLMLGLFISGSLTTIIRGILHCLDLLLGFCQRIIVAVKKIRAKNTRFVKFKIKDWDEKFVDTKPHGNKKVTLVEKKQK